MAEKQGVIAGFKDFIARGNAIDLAVGVVIGGAFAPIISAIVEKIINPLIAGLVGKPNFDQVLAFHIGGSIVQPGFLLTAIVNFLLVAIALYFFVVLPMNKLAEAKASRAGVEEEEPAVSDDVALLTEIRDLLAQNAQKE